jgi:hypothetical protein
MKKGPILGQSSIPYHIDVAVFFEGLRDEKNTTEWTPKNSQFDVILA